MSFAHGNKNTHTSVWFVMHWFWYDTFENNRNSFTKKAYSLLR